ncbi:MAG: CPA2 family monovalent cation:H+ antiporter-2, partial [Yoonia sp.]
MEHGADKLHFLQDLAVVMIVAGLVTIIFRYFKQPVVLGYILAGVLIGPNVLSSPLITSEESVQTLAELGVVFLLFHIGLEFNFRKIRKIGSTAFIVAPLETAVMFFLGYEIGQWFEWKNMDCVYLGAIMMISSTTIIAKTLAEQRKTHNKFAEVIFGILIAEDIIAIL